MAVHAGNSLYGKIDQVPGLFHVATEFFHVNLVPLLPTGTFLVLEGSGSAEPIKYRIGFSFKSVLFAWLRLALLLAAAVSGSTACVVAFVTLADPGAQAQARGLGPVVPVLDWPDIIGAAATSAGCWYLLYKSYQVTRATPERAVELAPIAGISVERLATCFPATALSDASYQTSLNE